MVYLGMPPRTPPKSPYKRRHPVDKQGAKIDPISERRTHLSPQYTPRQFLGSRHQVPARPIVYCPYCPQKTTVRHIESLEWRLDQYKEKKPKNKTIAEKFNSYRFANYKDKVIDLLTRGCTITVETMAIIEEMKNL
jgi:hypothetical protein